MGDHLRKWTLDLGLLQKEVAERIGVDESTSTNCKRQRTLPGIRFCCSQKRWDRLIRFLEVPGVPLDNNAAERILKKAILSRKNSYFYKTAKGAHVGDMFMSLIHTAELVNANPFDYLTELQKHAKELARKPGQWMPWNYRETIEQAEAAPSPSA